MSSLIDPPRQSIRDFIDESVAGLLARPGRTVMTVFGTLVGLTALVATLGLSRTAGNQIVNRFNALAATEIVVSASPVAAPASTSAMPWDAPARIGRLNGVAAVGNLSSVNVGTRLATRSAVTDPTAQTQFRLTVKAASPGLFAAARAVLVTGRLFDGGHSQRADAVVVLGPAAALRLGITSLDHLPAIRLGDDVFAVIGILQSVARRPELLNAVILPEGTAQRFYGLRTPELVLIETKIGATSLVARQTRLALRPDNPRALQVTFPPEPTRVRDAVRSDLDVLFLVLGGVSLLVGAIGIANVTLVSVIERTGEIGLRRALGASRRHIAAQFLLEGAAMGLVGGLLAGSLGTLVIVTVSAYQTWTPVLDPGVPLAAPILGAAIGLVSATYPSLRAAQLEPVEALRSAT